MAEQAHSQSPYNYTFNNPIRFIDPDGMRVEEKEVGGNPAQKTESGYTAAQSSTYVAPQSQRVRDFNQNQDTDNTNSTQQPSPQTTIGPYNPTHVGTQFLERRNAQIKTSNSIQAFNEKGMQLYPMQFGGPNFRAGTNVGLVEGMKAGAMIGLQTQFISFSGNTLKSLIKPYNSFARSTTGQFSGPNHNALRGAEYQD